MSEASSPDWFEWHDVYRDGSESHVARRLTVVQDQLHRCLDEAAPGDLSLVSLCAGQGHDVLGVLAQHPRAAEIDAVLIDSDERNTVEAGRAAAARGLVRVRSVTADAGWMSVFDGHRPVDVLLLCGMFGNITMIDVERTIAAVPSVVRSGGFVIWTRRNVPVDQTGRIRRAFDAAGCERLAFVDPPDDKFTVGLERFVGEPRPPSVRERLFEFVGFPTLMERGE